MPRINRLKPQNETPENLRPYLFHGLDLSWGKNKEATGECPFCSKEKFSVGIEKGLFHCKVCGEGGNAVTFLKKIWSECEQSTKQNQYKELQENRKLLHSDTLIRWEVVYSLYCDKWLIPGYNTKGNMTQLYRYSNTRDNGKALFPTPTLDQALFGVSLFKKSKPEIFLCEGPWDAMVMWEILSKGEMIDGVLSETGKPSESLLADINVLAVPGCNVFKESWLPLFENKSVTILFDNDHPKKHPKTQAEIKPAGWKGVQRIAEILNGTAEEVNFLEWGSDGFDSSFSSGTDIRDILTGIMT